MRNGFRFDKFSIDIKEKKIYKENNEVIIPNGYEILFKLVEAKANENSSDIVSSEDLLSVLAPDLNEINKSSVKDRLYHIVKAIRKELNSDVIVQKTPGYKLGYEVIRLPEKKPFLKSYILIASLVFVFLVLLFIFIPKQIDDDFPKIKISKATIHLNLNTDDWHDLNDEEINSQEIKSTGIFTRFC